MGMGSLLDADLKCVGNNEI